MAVSTLKECVSGMKELLMCAVCLEDVKEPRTLVCHHSFCTACLKSIELTGSGYQRKLQCPKCRKYTNVPRGGVGNLPMDCKLNELSEIHGRATRVELSPPVGPKKGHVLDPIRCVVCAQPTIHDFMISFHYYYCNNCHDYFCIGCSKKHKDIPIFKDHELICVVEKGREPKRVVCLDHSMKYKDYHCEECEQLVCSVCVATSHSEHTIRPFEKYDKICRDKISRQGSELFKAFHVPICIKGLPDEIKPLLDYLDITTDKVTNKINDAADAVKKDLEKQRQELTSLVKNNQSTIKKVLSANILKKQCNQLWGSDEPGLLLREHQALLGEIQSFFGKNYDGRQEIPELTGDSCVYDDFSAKTQGNSIGSLCTNTIEEFISKHRLGNDRKW